MPDAMSERDATTLSELRKRLLALDRAAVAFLGAYDRADSNRGCFSCVEPHDRRCPVSREMPDPVCACGRAELDAAEKMLREAVGT